MKNLSLTILVGILAGCGTGTGGQKDAATDGASDPPRTIAETGAVDSRDLAQDMPADERSGYESGSGELAPVDVPAAAIDTPAVDMSAVEAVGLDVTAIGERPMPGGATAACGDRQLSYADRFLGASTSMVNSLSFSPDGTRLAAGVDHALVVWTLGDGTDGGVVDAGGGGADGGASGVDGGTCGGAPVSCPAPITSVTYLPDGRLAGLFCGGQFIVFGCVSPNFLSAFAVSPVGSLVADAQSPIHLWDTWSGQQVRTFASGGASSVVFSPDGALLFGGVTGVGVRVWDVASGAERTTLPLAIAAPDPTILVKVSPDGRWFGALSSHALQIWNLKTLAAVTTFAVDPLAVDFIFTRDGSSVIAGGSRVNVYAVSDGSLLYQLGERSYSLALSPDGSLLAASGDRGVDVKVFCLY